MIVTRSPAKSVAYVLAVGICLVQLTSCGQGNGHREHRPESRHGQICEGVGEADANGMRTTTVPTIQDGTSVDDAMAILARAGPCGERPDVDFPYYVTGTDPTAGSVVDRGTDVTFMIGDG